MAADVVLTREGVARSSTSSTGRGACAAWSGASLGFSLVYNVAASAAVVLGFVGPLLAAVLMPVSSLTVVLSSAASRTFAHPPATRPARAVEA